MVETYNKKEFLLPESINSCASYHAKVFENGEYMFRIHDCITGIRLRGDLNTPIGIEEAKGKVKALISGLKDFENYLHKHF